MYYIFKKTDTKKKNTVTYDYQIKKYKKKINRSNNNIKKCEESFKTQNKYNNIIL